MFDFGNGLWVSPAFIISIVIRTDDDEDTAPEWRSWVEVRVPGDTFMLYMPDAAPGTLNYQKQKGLASMGYASCEDFCAKLTAAIKEAKHG